MSGQGKVIAGHYIDASVSTGFRGDLVVQTGLKGRKLTASEVVQWEEITPEAPGGSGVAGAVGKVVAGAVLPGLIGKMAGAAIESTLGSTARQPRTIRVDWSDGKQSLIRLPENLFTHLAVVLRDRRAAEATIPELVAAGAQSAASSIDVVEQIGKLAVLRDQGVLTESEFASKKGELLARL